MNFIMKILFFISFSFGLFNYQDILNKSSLSYSGYSNIYAINRTSDSELIKLPFRLISIDFGYNYGDFSFNANWGLEHKIKTLDSAQPINSLIYDLISKTMGKRNIFKHKSPKVGGHSHDKSLADIQKNMFKVF